MSDGESSQKSGKVNKPTKSGIKERDLVGATAAMYTAAILEYLSSEIFESADKATKEMKMNKITSLHLELAIRGDKEPDKSANATLPGGEVKPNKEGDNKNPGASK